MSQPSKPSRHAFEPLSRKFIAACIDVQKQLGLHCMEVDYQRALELALPKQDVLPRDNTHASTRQQSLHLCA